MPENFQFGYEHRLYIGAKDADSTGYVNTLVALDSRPDDVPAPPAEAVNYKTWDYVRYENIRTLSLGGNADKVDITTRDEARRGFKTEVNVVTTGEMNFDVRYKPIQDDGVPRDPIFQLLIEAWLNRTEIAAIDLDKPIETIGAQGLIGNWTVSFSNQKEVNGVVTASMAMTLSSFPDWIVRTAADGQAQPWTPIVANV